MKVMVIAVAMVSSCSPTDDDNFVRVGDFSDFDPRYRSLDDFSRDDTHNDVRYRLAADFTAEDARYLPKATTHDMLPGAGAPRHHIFVEGTAAVNVGAAGVVNVSPTALSFPADTLTRNPIVLRASAWTGTAATPTSILLAGVGPLATDVWPVRVYDPTGTFTTGAAIVELVVRIDP